MGLKIAKPVLAPDPAYAETFGAPMPAGPPSGTALAPSPTEQPAPHKANAASPPAPEAPPAPTQAAAPVRTQVAKPPPPAPVTTGRVKRGRRAAERREPPVMVNVKVRPLTRQAERIEEAGLPMQPILRAAWRQATAGLKVDTGYVAPLEADRAEDAHAVYRTTIRVDAAVLAELTRLHDPYGIAGRWALIRGQVEERFWTAVDDVIERFAPAEPGTAKGAKAKPGGATAP